MANYYPPVGFHFKVEVLGIDRDEQDIRFTDVGGLGFELSTSEVAEGGQNRFVQKYPGGGKYQDLVLKRGMFPDSKIIVWIKKCIENFDIEPKNIVVHLLNEEHEPLVTWNVVNAYPTKWSVSDLSASNNKVVVESIQFAYQYFSVSKE
jgi:phage tail-like protein